MSLLESGELTYLSGIRFYGAWETAAAGVKPSEDLMLLDKTAAQMSDALQVQSKAGMNVRQLVSYTASGGRMYGAYLQAGRPERKQHASRSTWFSKM